MANKTIALTTELYSGTTGMKLFLLHLTTGAIGNNATGDTLTEVVNGLFTTIVDEAITGWWRVLVTDSSDGPLIEGGTVYIPSDVVGTYVVDDPSILAKVTDVADATVNITPAYANQEAVVDNNKLTIRKGSRGWILIVVTDPTTGDPINLTVYTGLKFLVSVAGQSALQSQTVDVFGANNNQFYWKPNEASTIKERQLIWSLYNDIVDDTNQYYRAKPASGVINVLESPVA